MSAKCRGCGKEILWIWTKGGMKMPVDPEPVWVLKETGGDTFVTRDGRIIIGRKIGDAWDGPEAMVEECFVSHFATCPVGGQFRNRKPRTRPPGYR